MIHRLALRRKCRIDLAAYKAYCEKYERGWTEIADQVVLVDHMVGEMRCAGNGMIEHTIHKTIIEGAQFHYFPIPTHCLIPLNWKFPADYQPSVQP